MPEQGVLTARGTVYPWQCDHMGHMNVMWYVGKFDEGTWHLFALLGLTPTFLREHDRGMAAVQQELSYQRELCAGAVISVYSRVLEVREKVIRFSHDMHNDETHELAATTTITGVYLDTHLRKACALPDDVRHSPCNSVSRMAATSIPQTNPDVRCSRTRTGIGTAIRPTCVFC